eukprot:TRINITY_DN29735_c0_g1_i1.p1 TRINITY_DN29735_c0_g1~~TRINITY_DN29735_c0_g1_i1.p1  ORF type:complete len:260 (+),score=44.49 TRINITY_DN29735_c0_g1_i1:77-856(+)
MAAVAAPLYVASQANINSCPGAGDRRLDSLQIRNFNGLSSHRSCLRSTSSVAQQVRPQVKRSSQISCGLLDFVGGDLLGFDLGKWASEVEEHGAIGFYSPPEGGTEGRYANVLQNAGYHLMNVSARGLGDPEAYLTKIHGVRPPHLGKQVIARWYIPPEVDYRLSLLPPDTKGLLVWVGEAKVLAKNELQFLALLPSLRPKVKVICEMGSARKFEWKPLKEICGLPNVTPASTSESVPNQAKVIAAVKAAEEVVAAATK